MTRRDLSAQTLCDTLHRTLSENHAGHCWLLIDPSVRPLQAGDELTELVRVAGAEATAARCPDRRIAASTLPQLIPLVATRGAHSAVLATSVGEAVAELDANLLAHGNGRRIAGWLQSDASTDVLAHHIGNQLIQRRSGGSTLLHWINPAALWAFWPVLDFDQQAKLLGPIRSYRMLDPSGGMTVLRRSEAAISPTAEALNLTPAQWADADSIGALNIALRDWGAEHAEGQVLAAARDVGLEALRRARARGHSRLVDLAAYATRALSVDAHFDSHPLVRQRLDAAEPGAYVEAVLDELTPDDWRQIRKENAANPHRPDSASTTL